MYNSFETKLSPEKKQWELKHLNIHQDFKIADSENELKSGKFLRLKTDELEFSIEDRGEKDFEGTEIDEEENLYTK